jgi:hypothetical protein
MTNDLTALLSAIAERVIPGGCTTWAAEQTVWPDPDHPALWHCTVAHDDGCPTLERYERTQTQ